MLNYLKFATYQIFGFSCSIPKLNKIKKNPDNFTNKEIYDFLHKQAKKSLKLVNINLTINGKKIYQTNQSYSFATILVC